MSAGPEARYDLIDTGSERLVLAKDLAAAVLQRAGVNDFKRLAEVQGEALELAQPRSETE